MRKLFALLVSALFITSYISTASSEALPLEEKVVIEETLSAGGSHSCAVSATGWVSCWGYNGQGPARVPSDLGAVTQVSTGDDYSCALTLAGLVRCWGSNSTGQTSVPSTVEGVSQLSAGGLHSCALTVAGLVRCWGYNGLHQTDVPSDLGVVSQISAGGLHSCAVTQDGLVRCWGYNGLHQTDVPTDLGAVTQVSAGNLYTCALTVAGLVRCWGDDGYVGSHVPSDLGAVTQISAGYEHACALTTFGLVRCWGNDNQREAQAPSDLVDVTQVSAGRFHDCAMTDAGFVRCWGYNGQGQIDVPSDLNFAVDISVSYRHACSKTASGFAKCWGWNHDGQTDVPTDLDAVTQVSAGGLHSCAVTLAGLVRCWGDNSVGQTDVPADLAFVFGVFAGFMHTCAQTYNWPSKVRCWGWNNAGQTNVPSDLGVVSQISAGHYHTCAVTIVGLVRCWGDNFAGQSDVPSDLGAVTQVSAGEFNTCAVTAVGLVRCWGSNIYGQSDVPSDLEGVIRVSTGTTHSCARMSYGISCWGYNVSGQTDVPSDLGSVTMVTAGDFYSCALTTDGQIICWGNNYYGQTNAPTAALETTPKVFKQPRVLDIEPIKIKLMGSLALGSKVTAEFNLGASGTIYYQWYRNGFKIAEATQPTHTILSEDQGNSLTLTLLQRRDSNITFGTASVDVAYPSLRLSEPLINGTKSIGSLLTAAVDNSDPEVSLSYEWLRNGEVIAGAIARQHTVTLLDLGKDLSVRVTGSKERFSSTTRTSTVTTISNVVANSPCLGSIEATSSWLGTTSQPGISGSPTFGQTLKGVYGTWPSVSKYCVFWTVDGVVIPKATATTYKLQGSEVGKQVQFVVVGIDKSSKRVARVSEPLLVTKANLTNVKNPTVRGIAKVGVKLTSSLSSWGSGTSYGYQWLRNSGEISGATASSYVPTAADVGTNLSLRVCGTKPYFEQRCVESVSQVVSLGFISKVGLASVRGTSTNIGVTIFGNTTQWMPGVELSWQWLADGIEIEGANASTYTIARSDRGKTISLRITGYADGYQSVSKVAKYKKIP